MTDSDLLIVNDYLAELETTKRRTLEKLLRLVMQSFPELELRLAWNVPTLSTGDQNVLGLAAYNSHVSVSPWSPAVIERFGPRLLVYETTKNLIKFPANWEVDEKLICDLVSARLAEVQS